MYKAPSRRPHRILPRLKRMKKRLECIVGDLPFPSKHCLGDDGICSCNRKPCLDVFDEKDNSFISAFGGKDFYRSNIQRVGDELNTLIWRLDFIPVSFTYGNNLVLSQLDQMLCDLDTILYREKLDSKYGWKEVLFLKDSVVHRFSIKPFAAKAGKILKDISSVCDLARENILLADLYKYDSARRFFE